MIYMINILLIPSTSYKTVVKHFKTTSSPTSHSEQLHFAVLLFKSNYIFNVFPSAAIPEGRLSLLQQPQKLNDYLTTFTTERMAKNPAPAMLIIFSFHTHLPPPVAVLTFSH